MSRQESRNCCLIDDKTMFMSIRLTFVHQLKLLSDVTQNRFPICIQFETYRNFSSIG